MLQPHTTESENTATIAAIFNEHELIRALYASLTDREGFHGFLELLTRAINATAAELVVVAKQPLQIHHIWHAGLSDAFIDWYIRNNMIADDLVTNHATYQPPGKFHSAVPLLDTVEVSEGYKRWQDDQGLLDTAWLVVHSNATHTTLLTIQRTVAQGVYHDTELRQLDRLAPFIRQALGLYEQVAQRNRVARSLANFINAIPDATFVLNDQARILFANAAATELVARETCLSIADQRLLFDEAAQQQAFFQSSARVVRASMGKGGYCSDTLYLRRPNRTPLTLVIRPMESEGAGGALVTVLEPEKRPLPTAEQIASYFSLTPAEALLCAELVAGLSLSEIALRRHKSEATLRSYLKQIFRKTGDNRQGELISRVLCALL